MRARGHPPQYRNGWGGKWSSPRGRPPLKGDTRERHSREMSRRYTQLQQPLGMHPSVREEEGTWVGTCVTRTKSLSFSFFLLHSRSLSFFLPPKRRRKNLLLPPRSRVPLFRLHRSRRHRQTGGQALWSLLRPRPPHSPLEKTGEEEKGHYCGKSCVVAE